MIVRMRLRFRFTDVLAPFTDVFVRLVVVGHPMGNDARESCELTQNLQ
jgi:hypothetical protein